jgi:hypothetical protein
VGTTQWRPAFESSMRTWWKHAACHTDAHRTCSFLFIHSFSALYLCKKHVVQARGSPHGCLEGPSPVGKQVGRGAEGHLAVDGWQLTEIATQHHLRLKRIMEGGAAWRGVAEIAVKSNSGKIRVITISCCNGTGGTAGTALPRVSKYRHTGVCMGHG